MRSSCDCSPPGYRCARPAPLTLRTKPLYHSMALYPSYQSLMDTAADTHTHTDTVTVPSPPHRIQSRVLSQANDCDVGYQWSMAQAQSQTLEAESTTSGTGLLHHSHSHSLALPLPLPLPQSLSSSAIIDVRTLAANTRFVDMWPGHHTFLCGGRLMLGSNPYLFLFTVIVMLGTEAVWLWSMVADGTLSLYYVVGSVPVYAVILASLLLASLTDPGIVPPLLLSSSPVPSERDLVDLDGTDRKYCDYCHLYRPRRTKHCRYCNVCVEKFDHHCPYIGNCVGQRNYKYYLLFIFGLCVLSPYMFSLSLYTVVTNSMHIQHWDFSDRQWTIDWVTATGPLVLVMVVTLVSFLFTLSLSSYHCYLLMIGSTTNEEVRRIFSRADNVYHRGCVTNTAIVCSDSGESAIDRGYLLSVASVDVEQRKWREGEKQRKEREPSQLRPAVIGDIEPLIG